ncbi:hypothetical protein BDZ45DRAFT_467561 [Acephala macrosclerotiorum]|nr:hypothetical protein BDZ45DRAFT_467561 [Acephala macrosclerotiorum]
MFPPSPSTDSFESDNVLLGLTACRPRDNLPPSFGNLVGNTGFSKLETVHLENIVFGEDHGIRFLQKHAESLKAVSLHSTWDCTGYGCSALYEKLSRVDLKDVEIRGTMVEYACNCYKLRVLAVVKGISSGEKMVLEKHILR